MGSITSESVASRDHRPVNPSTDLALPALFWDKLDDSNDSADAAALRALKEESTPDELASSAKQLGNDHLAMGIKLRKSFYVQEAIQQYNRGLAEPIKEAALHSVLLANRAQAHWLLQNWRNSFQDSCRAVQLDPSNVKAYFRGARAATKLERFSDAMNLCKQGLEIQPDDTELTKLLNEAIARNEQHAERIKALAVKQDAKLAPARQLAEALVQRRWRVGRPQFSIHGRKPWVDKHGFVHWPVLFMYPQSMTNDVVEDVREDTTISAHLDVMFSADAPPLPWDSEGAYRRDNLDLFYLSHGATPLSHSQLVEALSGDWPTDLEDDGPAMYGSNAACWQPVNPMWTFAQLLDCIDYVVPGIPVLFVVARGTPYCKQFMKGVSDEPST